MQKLYYSISEVCNIVDEEQHILRYWEKEFEELNPKKNRAGNRIYSQKDVYILKTIKNYLRDEKLSLKGAKEKLSKLLETTDEESLFKEYKVQDGLQNQSNQKSMLFDNVKSDEKEIYINVQVIEELEMLLNEVKNYLK